MPGMKQWIMGAALALLVAESAAAQTQRTRPLGTIGYNAAERREAEARADRQAAEINRLATQNGLSRRLVRAVAVEVGLTNRQFTDAQLLRAVESAVERARELQADNTRLREEIGRLRDPALRDPALALLMQAESALEDGRLADAEAIYAQIRELRWDESRAAEEAAGAALEAEARTAELRQDFDRVEQIRLTAFDRAIVRREASHREALAQADAAAQARLREGRIFGRSGSLRHAISIYRDRILPMVPRSQYPDLWGGIQNNLGIVLVTLGERTPGPSGLELIEQAVTAYTLAQEVRTRDISPSEWAMTQNNLGNALLAQAWRTGGSTAVAMLERAVGAHRGSLEVRSLELTPVEWANSHHNLGSALLYQGSLVRGEAGLGLIQRALESFRNALNVRTRSERPSDWADTQSEMGNALFEQARLERTRSTGLYEMAIAAHRASLEVRRQDVNPVAWANSQVFLANALAALGSRVRGPQGLQWLEAAINAHRSALAVFTREAMPVDWGIAQQNIGTTSEVMGLISEGAQRIQYWRIAEQAYLQALNLYAAEAMHTEERECQRRLNRLRTRLAAALSASAPSPAQP